MIYEYDNEMKNEKLSPLFLWRLEVTSLAAARPEKKVEKKVEKS
jgi:hypothetical protein